jgi:HEAT repeat protein
MKHLTSTRLLEMLTSHQIMDRAFAAEELGHRRERAAIGPLCELLTSIEDVFASELDAAPFAIRALSQIGDASAARAIVKIVRLVGGYVAYPESPPITTVACQALVELRAQSALPALKELQAGPQGFLYRDVLARTIAELGGAAEAGFLMGLLGHVQPLVQGAGAAALGRLQHAPAVPGITALCQRSDDELRWSARCALVAMGLPDAAHGVHAETQRSLDRGAKALLLGIVVDQHLTSLAGMLFELSRDPKWASSHAIAFATLETAVQLGGAAARDLLRALTVDVQQSPCTRMRAAGILLEHGHPELLASCLEALRRCREASAGDPRDPATRRTATAREMIDALERFGLEHRGERVAIAEGLAGFLERELEAEQGDPEGGDEADEADEAAADPFELPCYLPDHASHALYALTGRYLPAELEPWRVVQRMSN